MSVDEPGMPLATPQVSVRPLLGVVAAVTVLVAVTLAGTLAVIGGDAERERVRPPKLFAAPRLQARPAAEFERIERQQGARLHDPDMSIEAAMARIAARGAEAYSPLAAPVTAVVGGAPDNSAPTRP